jgi:hypothetical protein
MVLFVSLIIIDLGILLQFRNLQPLTVDFALQMTCKETAVAYFEILLVFSEFGHSVIGPRFERRTYLIQARKPAI